MLFSSNLAFDEVIPVRRKTTNATLSGVLDTKGADEAWFVLHKGLVGASTTAYKLTFAESDTVSATFSGMTAITGATLTAIASLSTVAKTCLMAMACGNGIRKRFIGCKLSTTAGTSRAVGVLGFKFDHEQFPAASSQGFAQVSYLPAAT